MAIDTTARQLHHRVPRAVLESVTPFRSLIFLLFLFLIPYVIPWFPAPQIPVPPPHLLLTYFIIAVI